MTLHDLRLRLRALVSPRRLERELDDELGFHLEQETQKHVKSGLSEAEARARARQRFGSTSKAAEECRDVRGTALVATCIQDVAYAVRGFRRAPAVAFTVIGTVGLGLGLVAAVFTVLNAFVFRVDAVRDPGALFAVQRIMPAGSPDRPRFTLRQYEALSSETDVFSGVFARLLDITTRIDGRMMEGQLVTGNFFEVLGVTAARGRTLSPADDRTGASRVIVLSHRAWSRLFAADPNVLGRTVRINGAGFEIVGVTPEAFVGLDFMSADFWAPMSSTPQVRPWLSDTDGNFGVDLVGRLEPGVSAGAALAALDAWASRSGLNSASAQRGAGLRLEPRGTIVPLSFEVMLGFTPLFLAFGLILLIGCANVANLLLARAVSRRKEIAIRLSLGASRQRVIRQLLTESLLLSLAAAACGLALSRLVIDVSTSLVMRTMPPELAEFFRFTMPVTDWRVVFFLVAAAFVATAFFGLMPALHATRKELIRAVHGEGVRSVRPGRARSVLIVVQVTASALLLICAAIFLRSALRSAATDPGLRVADTLWIEIVNEPFREAMVQAVAAEPSVAGIAATWPDAPMLSRVRAAFGTRSDGTGRSPMSYRFVSPEYTDVLGIDVLQGRRFTAGEASGRAAVAMVSDAVARRLWPGRNAVGEVLRVEPDLGPDSVQSDEPTLPSQTLLVVGVFREVSGFRIAEAEAGVYVPTVPASAETSLIVRARSDPEATRHALLERLTAIDPNMGMVLTMRTLARLETYPLQIGFWLTLVLGALALLLTLSGIFSVLSYLVEQRTREIGIRIALGSMAGTVTRLVLSQSLRLVCLGIVAGGGFAWGLAALLMTTPAGARISGIVDVFDPVAYAASLLFIVVACALAATVPAMRAARIDPIVALRQE